MWGTWIIVDYVQHQAVSLKIFLSFCLPLLLLRMCVSGRATAVSLCCVHLLWLRFWQIWGKKEGVGGVPPAPSSRFMLSMSLEVVAVAT